MTHVVCITMLLQKSPKSDCCIAWPPKFDWAYNVSTQHEGDRKLVKISYSEPMMTSQETRYTDLRYLVICPRGPAGRAEPTVRHPAWSLL